MRHDSDEKMIKDALNTINTPEFDIMKDVKKKINTSKSPAHFKKVISIVLIACFCLVLSAGVIAATIPSFNNLLSLVSSDIALLLEPINATSTDEGIKMEVVGAMNDDEMAVIYVTMQDLTGNRIDGTLDIYDYSLSGAHMFNSQLVNYDKITKIATLRIEANGGKKLNNKKVAFSIDSFLSHKKIIDGINIGVNLSRINQADKETIPLDMNNIPGWSGDLLKPKEKGIINVLELENKNISIPGINFMYISNIGFIDGLLHIQTKWVGDGVDNHGYFYFLDKLGNKVELSQSNVYFGSDELGNTTYGDEYVEYIFDIKNINLNEVKLMGYFISTENYIKGNWETTFKLRAVSEEKQKECNIKFGNWTANSISITPMGITLGGNGESNDFHEIAVKVSMKDGSTKSFDSVRSFREGRKIKLKFISSTPLDISNIKSIDINGTALDFD